MASNILDIPEQYSDGNPVDAEILNLIFTTIEQWALINNRNIDQIVLDIFKRGYALGNDGTADFSKTLQDQMEFPNTLVWFDDFMEEAAALASTVYSAAHWAGSGSSGTQAVLAGAGGWMRLDTTSTGSRTSILTFGASNFDTLYNPVLEFYLKVNAITNAKYTFGFYASANDYIQFTFDTDVSATGIYLTTKNNGASEVSTDTLVDLRADVFFKFKIALASDNTFKVYIDDGQVAEAHTGTIRSLATFVPRFYADNKAAAQSNKMDIDYVRIIQDRSA